MNGKKDQEAAESVVEVERTFRLLSAIAQKGETISQRELSQRLGIALGLVNSHVKRLIRKGYIKVTTLPRNRLKYLLTPRGMAEKARLTYEYAYFSYRLYRATRQRCQELMTRLAEEGNREVVLYGTGDVAEIAYLSLQESALKLVAVVDGEGRGRSSAKRWSANPVLDQACPELNRRVEGAVSGSDPKARKFFNYPVLGVGELGGIRYHRVIVALAGPREEAEAELREAGVEGERVCWLEGGFPSP